MLRVGKNQKFFKENETYRALQLAADMGGETPQKFIAKFNELEVNLDFLQFDNDSSTRGVNVDRDEFGDRFFSGFESSSHPCFADEALSRKFIEKELLNLEKFFQ